MDPEEIQKRLVTVSQRKFRRVVALVLKRVLNYDSINVDGSGDGGSDWLAYQQGGQKLQTLPTDDDAKFHAWVEGQAKTFLKEQNVSRTEPASTP